MRTAAGPGRVVDRRERPTPSEAVALVLLAVAGPLLVLTDMAVFVYALGTWVATARTRWRGAEVGVALLLPWPGAGPGLAWLLTTRSALAGRCSELLPALEVCAGSVADAQVLPVRALGAALGLLAVAGVVLLVRAVRGRPVPD